MTRQPIQASYNRCYISSTKIRQWSCWGSSRSSTGRMNYSRQHRSFLAWSSRFLQNKHATWTILIAWWAWCRRRADCPRSVKGSILALLKALSSSSQSWVCSSRSNRPTWGRSHFLSWILRCQHRYYHLKCSKETIMFHRQLPQLTQIRHRSHTWVPVFSRARTP